MTLYSILIGFIISTIGSLAFYFIVKAKGKNEEINKQLKEEVKQADEIIKVQESHRIDADDVVRDRMLGKYSRD